jgi:hypothetical protein
MTPGYYSSNPDVDAMVAGMMDFFGVNPFAKVAHADKTVESIVEAVRFLTDNCDVCVASVHITVH